VIKNRLCQWLDALNARKTDASFAAAAVRCCVLATSNRVEDIDMSFRRGGRLEHEIVVLTSPADRRTLLQSLLTRSFLGAVVPGDDQQVFTQEVLTDAAAVIAERSGGYVAADLVALVRDMLSRFSQPSSSAHSQRSDRRASSHGAAADHLSLLFEQAARVVPPSCLRGVSIQLPSLNYSDVIGYEEVKRSLRRVLAFSSPDMMAKIRRFGLGAPGGVLLHGPPGNSKTRLVMAAAAHHGLPVISLSSADIFSPYVGDAEAEIRKAFRTARQARPCVLFIDELDSIVTNRESGGGSSSGVEGRVLATLLTEMDGIQGDDDRGGGQSNSGGVIVLGATNRLDFIDAALIRKVCHQLAMLLVLCYFICQGRFHHVLFVPLPNANERQLILQYFAEKCALDEKTIAELKSTVAKREGLSGAEIENLCREAVLLRFKNSYNV
jgi:transitional endoplasmic reticulum ATPase